MPLFVKLSEFVTAYIVLLLKSSEEPCAGVEPPTQLAPVVHVPFAAFVAHCTVCDFTLPDPMIPASNNRHSQAKP